MRYDKSKKMINNLLKEEIKNKNDNTEILPISKIDFILQKLNNNIYFRERSLKDYTENFGLCNKIIDDKNRIGTFEL